MLHNRSTQILLSIIAFLLFTFIGGQSYAQEYDTTVISINKDAVINSANPTGNYSTSHYIRCGTEPSGTKMTLFEFPLSDSIPDGAYVHSAILTLYGVNHLSDGNYNNSYLRRLTDSWSEGSVTWNTVPTSTTADQVIIDTSTSSDEDYYLDLTLHVRDMLLNDNNDGFILRLQNLSETAYLIFGSSNNPTPSLRPTLEVIYEIPDSLILQPISYAVNCESASSGGVDLFITGGAAPYSFNWDDSESGNWTTQNLSGMDADDYTVTITDALNVEVTTTVGVGFPVDMKVNSTLYNAATTGGYQYSNCNSVYQSVTKRGTDGWTEGGVSWNILDASSDGWVEFTIDEDGSKRMFGLTKMGTSDGNWTSMLFGFYMNGSGDLIVIEDGSQHSPVVSNYGAGDVLRITRLSSGISFKKNGIEVYNISNEASYFNYTDHMEIDVNVFENGGTMNGLRASFDNPFQISTDIDPIGSGSSTTKLDVLETSGCYAGNYSYALSDGTTTYTNTAITGGIRYDNLPAGDYELTVTRADLNNAEAVYTFLVRDDNDYNWKETEIYDRDATLISASKTYTDKTGRVLQSQTKNLTESDVIAVQPAYDSRGRPVLSSLPAPLYQSDFNYKPNFISNASGQVYDYTDFDLPVTSSNDLGEVNNPQKVNYGTKGTVGWYYGDLNDEEPYVATTHYPYSRKEFSTINPGRTKRASSPHNKLRMGSGHEAESYTMLVAGELHHVYGFHNGWFGGQYTETTETCDKVAFQDHNFEMEAFKSITYDQEGKESVSFYTNQGWLIATAYSGKADNDLNAETYDVMQVIKGYGDWEDRYVDVHLPEGCEGTIEIVLPTGIDYSIVDLKTESVIVESSTNPSPDLDPGVYRIIYNNPFGSGTNTFSTGNIKVKYNLNYYDYTLHYYDKNGQLIVTVPPLGTDLYKPTWSNTTSSGYSEFTTVTTSGLSEWGIGSTENQELSITVPSPTTQDPNHYNALTFYIDDGTTMKDDLVIESSSKSSQSLVTETTAKAISAGPNMHQYQSGASFQAGTSCSCSGNEVCITAGSVTAAYEAGNYYCPKGKYIHLDDKGGNNYCVSCADSSQIFVKEYEIELDLVQTIGEDEFVLESQVIVATEYSNGWQLKSKNLNDMHTSIPGGRTFSFKHNYGETTPVYTLVVSDVRGYVLDSDNKTKISTQDFEGLSDLRVSYGIISYYLNENPKHKLYSLYDYNSKGELISDYTPDEGKTEYLYSKNGRLRFSQNELQAASGRFNYYRYDAAGRLIENGEYETYNPESYNAEDQICSEGDGYYFQNYGDQLSTPSYGSCVRESEILDDEDYKFNPCIEVLDPTFVEYDTPVDADDYTYSGYCQRFTRGRVSKTWTQDDYDSEPRIETWYSYLPDGEIEWMIQLIRGVNGTDQYFSTDYSYNEAGAVSYVLYKSGTDYFEHQYTYDADLRLKEVKTRDGSAESWEDQASYTYYQHGPLKRTVLGDDIQGVDYIYNTMGWLKAINSPNLGYAGCYKFQDPGKDGIGSSTVATDVFGMTLDYFNDDYEKKFSNVNFGAFYAETNPDDLMNNWDGKIKSMRWTLQDDIVFSSADEFATENYDYDDHWMYTYSYNKKDWLAEASLGTYQQGCQNSRNPLCFASHVPFQFLVNEDEDYRVWNIDYDANGNIQNLSRRASESSGTNRMDELTYNYLSCTNKLSYIDDGYTTTGTYLTDLDDQSANNYLYNVIGQATRNEENSTDIVYDSYGLITEVKEKNTENMLVTFTYDDKGARLSKTSWMDDGSGGTKEEYTYWYINDASGTNIAIYLEDHDPITPSLSRLEHPVYGAGQVGTYYSASTSYLYPIKDHLGNTRAVVEDTKSSGDAQLAASIDYYPFGMEMPGRQLNPDDYRQGYQGEFTEKDPETGWDAFELRMWDARMARWMAPDPYRQYHSPYLGMGNNPVNGVDPDGGFLKGILTKTKEIVTGVSYWGTVHTSSITVATNFSKALKVGLAAANAGYSSDFVPPTIDDGGFIESERDFYKFMINQSNKDQKEITALEILDPKTNKTRYYVEPWAGNGYDYGYTSPDNPPNPYTRVNVRKLHHTHVDGNGVSYTDAKTSYDSSLPNEIIQMDGDVFRVDYSNKPKPKEGKIRYGRFVKNVR